MQAAKDTGPAPTAMPNELIVSLKHFPLVIGALGTLGIDAPVPEADDVSRALGLVRLVLTPRADANPALRQSADPTTLDIDKVLEKLREWFFDKYEWLPPIGKNRLVNHVAIVGEVTFGGEGEVVGAGEVTFGGGGEPETTSADPPWPARGAGPGHGARVGVADTQLAPQPWMAGGWSARWSDQEHDAEPLVTAGHATFVTGLVLSQAPGAIVEVRQVLDDRGTGKVWDVAKQIVSFGRSGIDVLNLSFACYTVDGNPPLALQRAIDRLDPEIVVVAAAGNVASGDGPTPPAWPAAFDNVVAVGAAETDGTPVDFSPNAPWLDLRAPGLNVRSLFLNGTALIPGGSDGKNVGQFDGYARWSGTSFASALVSGTIAAGVSRGRISARDSLEDILTTLHDTRRISPDAALAASPPFLRVRVPD